MNGFLNTTASSNVICQGFTIVVAENVVLYYTRATYSAYFVRETFSGCNLQQ
jgi:hypothetical protein